MAGQGGNRVPIQMFIWHVCDQDSDAYFSDSNSGLQWVIDPHDAGVKIAAVNASLGRGANTSQVAYDSAKQYTNALIDNLKSRGIASLIFSGKSGATQGLPSKKQFAS